MMQAKKIQIEPENLLEKKWFLKLSKKQTLDLIIFLKSNKTVVC